MQIQKALEVMLHLEAICYHPPPMSILTHVPDGFYQPSRINEQLRAVSVPVQYSMKTLLLVTTLLCGAAAAAGPVVRSVMMERQREQAAALKTANPQP